MILDAPTYLDYLYLAGYCRGSSNVQYLTTTPIWSFRYAEYLMPCCKSLSQCLINLSNVEMSQLLQSFYCLHFDHMFRF